MNLAELDTHIEDLENKSKEIAKELAAAKNFRPFLAAREPGPATAPQKVVQPPLIENNANGDGYGATLKNIRSAIGRCPTEYTVYNVENALTEMHITIPRMAISQALSRLAKRGEITVKTPGTGRAASTFTKQTTT